MALLDGLMRGAIDRQRHRVNGRDRPLAITVNSAETVTILMEQSNEGIPI
jgi:hypothetical protein